MHSPPGALLSPKARPQQPGADHGPHCLLFPGASDPPPNHPHSAPSRAKPGSPGAPRGGGPPPGGGGGPPGPHSHSPSRAGCSRRVATLGSELPAPLRPPPPRSPPTRARPAPHSHSGPRALPPGPAPAPRQHLGLTLPLTKPCPPQPDPGRPLETPSLRLEVQEFGGGGQKSVGPDTGKEDTLQFEGGAKRRKTPR